VNVPSVTVFVLGDKLAESAMSAMDSGGCSAAGSAPEMVRDRLVLLSMQLAGPPLLSFSPRAVAIVG
jgi:hypothetical protein